MFALVDSAAFLGLGLLGLLVLGGLLAVILMIAHPKTRVAGGILLVVGLVVSLAVGLGLFGVVSRAQVQARNHAVEARIRIEEEHARAMAEDARRMAAEGRARIEQHGEAIRQQGEAMRQQADAMREQADAMRQEADATRRRIEEATTRAMVDSSDGVDLEEARQLASQPLFMDEQDGAMVESPTEVVVEPVYPMLHDQPTIEAYPQMMSSPVPRMWTWARLALIVLALLAFVLLGTSVVMLARPKTRVAGGVLLVIVLPLLLVAGVIVPVLGHFVSSPTYSDNVTALRPPKIAASPELAPEYRVGPEPIPLEEHETTGQTTDVATPDHDTPATRPPAESPAESPTAQPAETREATERPAWVDEGPKHIDNVHQLAITTAPYPSRAECEAELDKQVREMVRGYMRDTLGRSDRISQMADLPRAYIDEQIVVQKWAEPVHISLGEWVRVHALLQFDDEVDLQLEKMCDRAEAQMEERWAREAVVRRLCYSGTGVAALLMLLTVLYGCLRIDTSTGGACRGRLCVAGGALVLIVAALAMLAVVAVAGLSAVDQAVMVHPTAAGLADVQGSLSVGGDVTHSKAFVGIGGIILLPIVLVLVGLAVYYKKTRAATLVLLGLVAVASLFALA